VGLGFNDHNHIVGADLLLMRVRDDRFEYQDMIVKGIGNPVEDRLLKGQSSIEVIAYEESDSGTTVRFKRLMDTGDKNDYVISPDDSLWVIMAYSTHDDFSHHSRIRKHAIFSFQP